MSAFSLVQNRRRRVEHPIGNEETASKRVKITMKFDVADKDVNDVCIEVKDKMFHCSRRHLCQHSSYLKALLSGTPPVYEEVEVDGVMQKKCVTKGQYPDHIILEDLQDPDAFELFLKLINGIIELEDENIEEMLDVARILDAPVAKERCEEFLIEDSKFDRQQKFELCVEYDFLEDLKDTILCETKTIVDLKQLVGDHIGKMNLHTSQLVIAKMCELATPPGSTSTSLFTNNMTHSDLLSMILRQEAQRNNAANPNPDPNQNFLQRQYLAQGLMGPDGNPYINFGQP